MDATTLPQNNQLEQYLDTLVSKRFEGMEDVTEEERQELKADAGREFFVFFMNQVVNALSEEDFRTLEQMAKENKPLKEMEAFTSKHIANYGKFSQALMQLFEERYTKET